ncbi:hypothetical protein AB4254_11105 [Vibrio breoganii]
MNTSIIFHTSIGFYQDSSSTNTPTAVLDNATQFSNPIEAHAKALEMNERTAKNNFRASNRWLSFSLNKVTTETPEGIADRITEIIENWESNSDILDFITRNLSTNIEYQEDSFWTINNVLSDTDEVIKHIKQELYTLSNNTLSDIYHQLGDNKAYYIGGDTFIHVLAL